MPHICCRPARMWGFLLCYPSQIITNVTTFRFFVSQSSCIQSYHSFILWLSHMWGENNEATWADNPGSRTRFERAGQGSSLLSEGSVVKHGIGFVRIC